VRDACGMLVRDPQGIDPDRYAEYADTANSRAATLRSAAIRVGSGAGGVGRGVAGAAFHSPSAVRFRDRMDDLESGLRRAADLLDELAERLDEAAEHYRDLSLAARAAQP
jgi:uncharacterized protein YukE